MWPVMIKVTDDDDGQSCQKMGLLVKRPIVDSCKLSCELRSSLFMPFEIQVLRERSKGSEKCNLGCVKPFFSSISSLPKQKAWFFHFESEMNECVQKTRRGCERERERDLDALAGLCSK